MWALWLTYLLSHYVALALIGIVAVVGAIYKAAAAPAPILRTPGEPESPPVVAPGDRGIVATPLRPSGRASFGGKPVEVMSDGGFVDPGTPVRVLRYTKGKIVVRASR